MTDCLKNLIARSSLGATSRSKRAARTDRADLKAQLRTYSSEADRLEMSELLAQYPETETHQVWQGVLAESSAGRS